jgi:hypothetical protein
MSPFRRILVEGTQLKNFVVNYKPRLRRRQEVTLYFGDIQVTALNKNIIRVKDAPYDNPFDPESSNYREQA